MKEFTRDELLLLRESLMKAKRGDLEAVDTMKLCATSGGTKR